jgi:PPOX class probable F420-dependent enzyme
VERVAVNTRGEHDDGNQRAELCPTHPCVVGRVSAAGSLGQRTIRRLREELFIWLITVDTTGTPHTLPVGFLWDEAHSTFLIYSASEADRDRLTHIQQNPKVGLHFNLDLSGADSFILTGEASVSTDDPPSDQIPAWVEKYQVFFSQMGLTIQQAAVVAPVALRVRPLTMVVSSWTTSEK